jgi:glycosyltransferase involved in cell wall biosynthesis
MDDLHAKPVPIKLIVMQPVLYEYRSKVFSSLNKLTPCYMITSLRTLAPACAYVNLTSSNPLAWASAVFHVLINYPDRKAAFVPAYTGHLGIVLSALFLSLFRIPIFVHGQALFKKPQASHMDWLISLFWLGVSCRYLSYSAIGIEGPFLLPCFKQKISVLPNRFESICALGLENFVPNFASFTGANVLRVLFIGRDRPGARLDLALQLIELLRTSGKAVALDIIGVEASPAPGVTFHGPLFADNIREIAANCHVGLYPGDAGLSVLHYMALGLCPVVHRDIRLHSGPEPGYLQEGISARLFERGSLSSLADIFLDFYSSPRNLAKMRSNAHSEAIKIHHIPLSVEIHGVVNSVFANPLFS